MEPEYFWWGGMWIFPIIMPLIMLTVMLIVLYMIFGRGGFMMCGKEPENKESETALEILKKRYAKGEITKAEFEQMKNDILR